MRPETRGRLADMLHYAGAAVRMLEGRDPEDLERDEMLFLALSRALEIVGEAAYAVPEAERAGLPGLPWRQIVGMRHRLVHGYAKVDPFILYDVAARDLPPVISELEAILNRTTP